MIGPPCGPLPGDYGGGCYAYFVYDNLILASNNFFNTITIEETGSFCTNDVTLTAEADSVGGTWQWYYEGVALVGETDSILNISANGLDRKSTRLNSSHVRISYAVFCLKKKKK